MALYSLQLMRRKSCKYLNMSSFFDQVSVTDEPRVTLHFSKEFIYSRAVYNINDNGRVGGKV